MDAREKTGGLVSLIGKILIAATSLLLSAILFGGLAEIYVRAKEPLPGPDTLLAQSIEYESTLFSRDAFPQMAQHKVIRDPHTPLGRRELEINDRGTRGRRFALPKPPGTVRVIVLGGSSAYDVYALEGRDWPHLIEGELHRRGFRHVEVINAGTPGHSTWDVLGRFHAEIWMFQPDIVLLYSAWNDIKYFSWLTPDQSLLRGYRPKPSAWVLDRDTQMIANPFIYYSSPLDRSLCRSQLYLRLRTSYWKRRLEEEGVRDLDRRGRIREGVAPTTMSDTYGPWGPRQYKLDVSLIVETARAIGARPVLLTEARAVTRGSSDPAGVEIDYKTVGLTRDGLLRAFDECDRAIRDVAREKQVDLFDVSAQMSGRAGLFADEVHVTAKGSAALGRAVAEYLARILPPETAKATGGLEGSAPAAH